MVRNDAMNSGHIHIVDEDEERIQSILQRIAMLYGWSLATVDAYQRDLFTFHRFCVSLQQPSTAFLASQAQITDYLRALKKRNLANSSIARHRSAMATWFHYLQNEKLRTDFPMQDVSSILPSLRLPKHISEDDVEDLIQAPDTTTKIGLRSRCVLELLYATGLRVSELASLKVANINRVQKTLRVIGKGNKEREIPYGDQAEYWLNQWFMKLEKTSIFLFPSKGGHLSRQTLWRCVYDCATLIGLQPVPSPHVLRHAFATHMLNHGADLRAVQTLLGHENITTTEIYTHVSRLQMYEEVNKRHPMGKMKRD